MLFLRVLDDEAHAAAFHTVVEDHTGDAELLALYHSLPATDTEPVLPVDAVLALKAPYFEILSGGTPTLRVDHPSDIVRLTPLSPTVPERLRATTVGSSATGWKAVGNEAYKAGKHVAAVEAYSQALDLCTAADTDLKYDLLRNRAIVNTYLRRYQAALDDAEGAVIPDHGLESEVSASRNAKAHHRAGRAAYELGTYKAAKQCFEKERALMPNDDSITSQLERTEARLQEQSAAVYDFERMSESASKRHNRLDHASFLARTTVQKTETRGRGLFATQNISAGDLVLCEKAFSMAFDSDKAANQNYTILDSRSQRKSTGTQATLLFNTVQNLLHDPEKAAEFAELYDFGYTYKTSPVQIDGVVPVDVFRAQAVIEYNSYGCPTVRSSSKAAQKQIASSSGYPSTGLWLRIAYINHACNGNTMRSFIGDMMILRATRDISEGEEILMPYRLPNVDNTVTQSEIQRIWGFVCDCELCTVEKQVSTRDRRERLRLVKELENLLSSTPVTKKPNNKTLSQVQRLHNKLESTYDAKLFDARPRLALIAPGLWLSSVHLSSRNWESALAAAIGVLRDLGFIATFTAEKLDIQRRYCHAVLDAIRAAGLASRALKELGKREESEQMEEFGRGLYVVMHGEMRGFEEMFRADLDVKIG